MLAYPLSEAETMLQEKLTAAEQSLANCDEDLEFLREQITVSYFVLHVLYPWLFFSFRFFLGTGRMLIDGLDARGCDGTRV